MPLNEGSGNSWTGFVLVVAPVAGLAVDPDALYREVQEQVEQDVVLQDTVKVGISADVAYGYGADPVVQALSSATLDRGGRMFAPGAVFGCAVVGNDIEEANRVVEELAESSILRRLNVSFYAVAAQPDASRPDLLPDDFAVDEPLPRRPVHGSRSRYRPDVATTASVVGIVVDLMEAFEDHPELAISARRFAQITTRPPKPVVSPRVTGPSDRAVAPPSPPVPLPPPSTYQLPADDPYARKPGFLARRLSAITAKPAPPTQAEALDRLATTTNAVSLVYLVLPADPGRVGREVHRRRAEVVVELDRALALAAPDVPVQIVPLLAGRRLTRCGPMTPAGKLTSDLIPKVPTGPFDLVSCVDDLLGIHERDSASLARRGIGLTAVHVVFVSAGAPLADAVSVGRLEEITRIMQARWILLGNAWDLMSGDFTAIGVQSFEDHPDVANELVTTAFTVA